MSDNKHISKLQYFWSTVIASLFTLLVIKGALVAYTISGAEGKTSAAKTIGKSFLCLGWDVFGAILFALLAIILTSYALTRLKPRFAFILLGLLVFGHAFYLIISYGVQMGVGTPFDKAAIELAFLNEDAVEGVNSASIWVSIAPFLNYQTFLLTMFSGLLPALLLPWINRRLQRMSHLKKTIGVSFGVAFMITTIAVLPFLRNGEVFGIRVHTFGLERSHFVWLVKSYIVPPVRSMLSEEYSFDDPYCMSMESLEQPQRRIDNPLTARREAPKTPTDVLVPTGETPDTPHAETPLSGILPQKTNVVIVLLESVAQPYMNAEPERMPFTQKLSSQTGSATLKSHYATWPQTMKAIFSLLCSELPYPDYQPITHINPAIPSLSLPEVLKHNGYATALFTSASLAYDRQLRFYRNRKLDVMYDMYNMPGREKAWQNAWGLDESATISSMFDWVKQQHDKNSTTPFFLLYGMATGHHPYTYKGVEPPKIANLKNERKQYSRCMTYIDDRIKEVYDHLDRMKLRDNTLVLVISDHGEGFGQHPLSLSHGPMVYEEAIHVPALFSGPQFAGINPQLDFPTSHIDIAPTILGLLGIEPPKTMKGRDLTTATDDRLIFFGGRPPTAQAGVRDGAWKFMHIDETDRSELYNIDRDPLETDDLSADHPDQVERYLKTVRFWKRHSRNLIENYTSIMTDHGRSCASQ